MRARWLVPVAALVAVGLAVLALLLAGGTGSSPAARDASETPPRASSPSRARSSPAEELPRLPGPRPGDPESSARPSDPEAWQLARTALTAAEYAEAIALCERGLAAGDPDDEVLFDCAIAACATGDAGAANTLIRGLAETRSRARVYAMCRAESIEIE